jgi:ribonuclease HII
MQKPTFDEEQILWKKGYEYIAGVDEVGRGCFAGPVVTAAVILPSHFSSQTPIDDSKRLSPKKREELAIVIKQQALAYAIAQTPVETINAVGIGEATQQSFLQSLLSLDLTPQFVLIDAFYVKNYPREKQKALIHGDQRSISIAAASIIAKVYRDALMKKLPKKYDLYDFATNKGYGTKKHREAIGAYGLCDLHRTSFSLQKFVR